MDEELQESKGITCPRGHFFCASCYCDSLQDELGKIANDLDLGQEHKAREGKMRRPQRQGAERCEHQFTDHQLARCLSDEEFSEYAQARDEAYSSRVRDIAEIEVRQQIQRDRERQDGDRRRGEEEATADMIEEEIRAGRYKRYTEGDLQMALQLHAEEDQRAGRRGGRTSSTAAEAQRRREAAETQRRREEAERWRNHKFGNADLKAAAKEWCEDSGKAEAKYGYISGWDTSEVTSMRDLFSAGSGDVGEAAKQFNGDISRWNVEKYTVMMEMFYKAESFNQDLSGWNVEKCLSMSYMFYGAMKFNKDSVKNWNLSRKNTTLMFAGCG
ncbi:hypothetical protein TL16_g05862 [Triparma laevis f. inornata]|uniref:Uncharacterized protein n=2 Tax=Triparma laevis TaxID=1534972 RepID=A0A9W7F9X8_9STRA|nr:hypothetical protein TL16_g05862 [Triparma laevis f. inornata]GMI06578.1 hypothetical protein TrLO_g3165 [Triparma laevis f. longispina]